MSVRSTIRRSHRLAARTAACALLGLAGLAQADDSRWWAHVGAARVDFRDEVTLAVGGSVVPGAGAKLSDETTLGLELGYQFTPAWSASVLVGIPPTAKVTATGTAAPLGQLGEVRYGPLAFLGQYRFGDTTSVRPYVGAGAVYFMVMESKDGSLAGFDAESRWGSVLQAGIEVPLGERYGLFFDVKKMFLKTSATATVPAFGGAPARAEVTLDPLVLHAGLNWRF